MADQLHPPRRSMLPQSHCKSVRYKFYTSTSVVKLSQAMCVCENSCSEVDTGSFALCTCRVAELLPTAMRINLNKLIETTSRSRLRWLIIVFRNCFRNALSGCRYKIAFYFYFIALLLIFCRWFFLRLFLVKLFH